MTSICLSTKRVPSTVQWQNKIIFKCVFFGLFFFCSVWFSPLQESPQIHHLNLPSFLGFCFEMLRVPFLLKNSLNGCSLYWNYNSCKDKLSVQLGSSTDFHDQPLAGKSHPWAAWSGSPSKPGRQIIIFFLKELSRGVDKAEPSHSWLQNSFPWGSSWRLCRPTSIPVTPAVLKAAISSSTCL